MALTFSLAGLRTALDAVNDAGTGEPTRAALKAYALTYAGLPKRVKAENDIDVEFPDPDKLAKLLAETGALDTAELNVKRRGRIGVSHA